VDLVVDEVVQLQHVDVADPDPLGVGLAGPAVEQLGLAAVVDQPQPVALGQAVLQQTGDLLLVGAVEHRRGQPGIALDPTQADVAETLGPRLVDIGDVPARLGDPAEVGLQNLADVHPGRDAERVEHDVHGRAVLQERHVLDRQDFGDDALVAVASGQLVTVGDLPLLGHVDPDQLVDPRRQFVALLAVEDADADDGAGLAVGHLHRGVAHLARLLAEDRAEQPLLGGQLGLALRGDLADQDVPGPHLGTDPDDAALVEVGEHVLADVGDVAGDLLGTELGVPGVDLVFLDVDRGQHVVLHQPLGQDDRILVVVALPGHERDQQVAAQRHLAAVGTRPVRQRRADLDPVAVGDQRPLVDAGGLVGATELGQPVAAVGAVVVGDVDDVGAHRGDHTGLGGHGDVAGVHSAAVFHPGADIGGLVADQRHRLALHVGAHQRPGGVVVLQEGDQRGGHRHHLPRGHVHVLDGLRGHHVDVAVLDPHQHALLGEPAVRQHLGVGLRDDVAVLLIGGQVVDLFGHVPVDHLAVRGLDETERVHPSEGRQRPDEADVRAFRGLDRAHPSVMAVVDVADLHARAVAGEAARAERGETPLVGEPGHRVGLVHELGELGGPEELLEGRRHRTDVDQRLRGDRLDVLGGHPVPDGALQPAEPDPQLVLDEFAHRPQPAVTEVVDVVGLDDQVAQFGASLVQGHHVADRRHDVLDGQDLGVEGQAQAQLLVDLVAADLGQVVALGVEVVVLQHLLRGLAGRRLPRAQLAVDVQQRLVGVGGVVPLQGEPHRLVLAELAEDLLVRPSQRLEQHGDVLLALAVQADADHVPLVDLELQPGAPARDHLAGEDVLVRGLVRGLLEVDPRRPDQLADHDPLGAVDDEGALVGHQREVAHEHGLALDLTGVVVHELGGHEQRGRVGHVPVLALLDRMLGILEPVVAEGQRHGLRQVLDR